MRKALISLCVLVVALAYSFASAPSPPDFSGNVSTTAIGLPVPGTDFACDNLNPATATAPAITADFQVPVDVGWMEVNVANFTTTEETGLAPLTATGLNQFPTHRYDDNGNGGPASCAMLSLDATMNSTTIRATRDGHTGMPVLAWNINCRSNRQTAMTQSRHS